MSCGEPAPAKTRSNRRVDPVDLRLRQRHKGARQVPTGIAGAPIGKQRPGDVDRPAHAVGKEERIVGDALVRCGMPTHRGPQLRRLRPRLQPTRPAAPTAFSAAMRKPPGTPIAQQAIAADREPRRRRQPSRQARRGEDGQHQHAGQDAAPAEVVVGDRAGEQPGNDEARAGQQGKSDDRPLLRRRCSLAGQRAPHRRRRRRGRSRGTGLPAEWPNKPAGRAAGERSPAGCRPAPRTAAARSGTRHARAAVASVFVAEETETRSRRRE